MTLMRALDSLFSANNRLPRRPQIFHIAALATLMGILVGGTCSYAASINYGNFNVPSAGIMFQNVTESSGTDPVPMYGVPDPFVVGLDFDPTNFISTSSGGGADITDGQLNFTIMGLANANGFVGVNGINLSEAGDYSLAGAGTPATSVSAGAIMRVTVTQINGLAIAPVNLIPVNASFSDSLPGAVVASPWSLGLFLDVATQLQNLGFGANDLATKVEVAINNALTSSSEASTVSFIAKKEFRISLTPETVGDPFIPEPSSLMLLSAIVGTFARSVNYRVTPTAGAYDLWVRERAVSQRLAAAASGAAARIRRRPATGQRFLFSGDARSARAPPPHSLRPDVSPLSRRSSRGVAALQRRPQ
jgi:hypothetical protein